MVSKSPNPPEGFYLDPKGMALPGLSPFAAALSTPSTTSSSEDLSKKIRKPYTITKSRESWTEPEHDKFLEALQLPSSSKTLDVRKQVGWDKKKDFAPNNAAFLERNASSFGFTTTRRMIEVG